MTAYRDRLEAGMYQAVKPKDAEKKVEAKTKARAARSITTKSTKGLR